MPRSSFHSARFVIEERARKLPDVGHEELHLDDQLRQLSRRDVYGPHLVLPHSVPRLALGALVVRRPVRELRSINGHQSRAQHLLVEFYVQVPPYDRPIRLSVQRR